MAETPEEKKMQEHEAHHKHLRHVDWFSVLAALLFLLLMLMEIGTRNEVVRLDAQAGKLSALTDGLYLECAKPGSRTTSPSFDQLNMTRGCSFVSRTRDKEKNEVREEFSCLWNANQTPVLTHSRYPCYLWGLFQNGAEPSAS